MEQVLDLEQKITKGIDLLEIAKTYCDAHYDKANQISNLDSMIEIMLENQKEILGCLDRFYLENKNE